MIALCMTDVILAEYTMKLFSPLTIVTDNLTGVAKESDVVLAEDVKIYPGGYLKAWRSVFSKRPQLTVAVYLLGVRQSAL